MKNKQRQIISFEIIDDLLKIGVVSKQEGSCFPVIDSFSEVKVESAEKIGQHLATITASFVKKNLSFVLLLPRKLSTVKYIDVPSCHDEEIKKIIGFQAVKQVPFPLEEIIVGFQQLQVLENGYSKVMLVIVHKDIIRKQLGLLANAAIYPEKILLNTQSVGMAGQQKIRNNEDGFIVFLEIDYNHINFLVLSKKVFAYSRSFSIADLSIEQICFEVARSLSDCKQQAINPEKIVILNKGLFFDSTFCQALSKTVDLPIEEIPFENKVSKISSLYGTIGVFDAWEKGMNFLPEELLAHNKKRTKLKEYSIYAFLLSCLLLVLFFVFSGRVLRQEKYLFFLTEQLNRIEPKAKKLASMKKRVDAIEASLSLRGSPLDVLRDIYLIFPEKVTISSLSITKGKLVVLKGIAANMGQVFDLIPKLEKSAYLTNVASKYATKRKIKGEELIEFQLNAVLKENRQDLSE